MDQQHLALIQRNNRNRPEQHLDRHDADAPTEKVVVTLFKNKYNSLKPRPIPPASNVGVQKKPGETTEEQELLNELEKN